ncbi:uncharacterized protein [Amphiura filiformis]|uniref:uncharacterized protein n=1 Tax=Amphiura filiformis TaxID=82378 RepID=UPI003B2185D9
MSNFNAPMASASQSALSLGGEWRSRDQAEANKYKMSTLLNRKRDKNKTKTRDGMENAKERPRSSPGMKSSSSLDRPTPPKSAPPGAKPRCERVHEMEGERSARKNLEAHLPLKKSRSPVNTPDLERKQQINLGPGMTLTRSKSRLAVTINTGLPDLPEATPRRIFPKDPEPPQGDPERLHSSSTVSHGDAHQSTHSPVHSQHKDRIQSWVGKTHSKPNMPWLAPPPASSSIYHTEGHTNPGLVQQDWSRVSPVPSSPSFRGNSTTPGILSPDVQDALIVQLQQQVSDLTLFLEEERLNHKATKEKAAAAMREQLNDLERRHMEELKEITQEQEEQVEMIKEIHGKEMTHLKNSSNAALARMKGELEFLQGAFEAYKGTLVQDMEEKWNKKEIDMKLKFQEDMENVLQEQRQELLEERQREKKQLAREFQKQMQIMQKEHKKEIDGMLIKFSSASTDVENLKKALDHLKRVQDDLEETQDKLVTKEDELRQSRMELAETRLRVTQYEENFQSRVDEVDEKYKERIHHLMNENSELRTRYMQKCDELFTEKAHTEKRRVEKLMNTKEVMRMLVHVKSRNSINLACSDPATDHQSKIPMTRPASAPVTKHDKQFAFRSAGETKHLQASPEKELLDAMMPPPPRPRTVAAHRVQSDVMREFAMLSPFRTESIQSL